MIKNKTLKAGFRGGVQYKLEASNTTLLDTNWTDIQNMILDGISLMVKKTLPWLKELLRCSIKEHGYP